MSKFFDKYLGEKVAYDERLFYLSTVLSALFSFIFILFGLLFSIEDIMLVGFGTIGIISVIMFVLESKFHKLSLNTDIFLVLINVLIFPTIMVVSNRKSLEIPIYMITGYVFSLLLLHGVKRIIVFIFQILIDLSAAFYVYVYTVEIWEYLGSGTSKTDDYRIVLAIAEVFILCGVIVTYNNYLLNHQLKLGKIATQKAQEISYAKDMFLVNVSHEIRTPLNAILGTTDMILDGDCQSKVKEMALNITNSSHALLSITNDLLDFSSVNLADTPALVIEKYDLSVMLNDIINMLSVKILDVNVYFYVEIDPNIPKYLYGDSSKVRQILLNILSNAVKFTEEGHIILKVGFEQIKNDAIRLVIKVTDTGVGIKAEDLKALSYELSNHKTNQDYERLGLGLSISKLYAEQMGGKITVESVYKKGSTFKVIINQSCDHVSYEYSICKLVKKDTTICFFAHSAIEINQIGKTLEDMNISSYRASNPIDFVDRFSENLYDYYFLDSLTYDYIKVELEDSHIDWKKLIIISGCNYSYAGEPFDYVLARPITCLNIADLINKTRNYSIRSKRYEGAFTIPNATILVVDDNLVNLEVAASLLGRYEGRIITAASGTEALITLQNEHIDMVFLDYMMPEMDGIETLANIRNLSDGKLNDLPVICLTANSVSGARELFLNAGFDDYISKPIEIKQLESVIAEHMDDELIKYN